VIGTSVYIVKLWLEGRRLDWSCTCPVEEDGEFCKHAVATGLAWIAAGAGHGPSSGEPELDVVRRFLEDADQPTLVAMLLEQAFEDDELLARLLLAAHRRGVSDPRALKETIRKAFGARDFVDYAQMREVCARASAAPELLEELLKRGDLRGAAELSAEAMRLEIRLLENSDDSDGLLGEILRGVTEVYRKAVKKGALERAELAKSLFALQLADGLGFFGLENYVRALGKEGLEAYRKLARAQWEKVPALRPGSRASSADRSRYQLARILRSRRDRWRRGCVGRGDTARSQPIPLLAGNRTGSDESEAS